MLSLSKKSHYQNRILHSDRTLLHDYDVVGCKNIKPESCGELEITDVNKAIWAVEISLTQAHGPWILPGWMELTKSLLQASQYIETVQQHQNVLANLEIAYRIRLYH